MAEQKTRINALDNGPYLIKDPVVVVDAEGYEFPSEHETIALCRCGASTNEPFCDGTPTRRSVFGRRSGPSGRRESKSSTHFSLPR